MTILSDTDLHKALEKGDIYIDPKPNDDQIGAGSIDLTLSNEFYVQKESLSGKVLDLEHTTFEDAFDKMEFESINIKRDELILAKTLERIKLAPNICGWIQGRSMFARLGLTVHVASSFIHPGSNNHQILEIANLSRFEAKIHAGMRVCQVVFEKTQSPASKPYGEYGKKFAKQ